MALTWDKMNVMEPDWYRAVAPHCAVELHMNWDEDRWLLVRDENVIYDTQTSELTEAQNKAERWLISELR
jgi:hypothetical protein